MNTNSVTCRKVEEITQVGDFGFDEPREHIYVWIPGTTGPDAIRICREGDRGEFRVWGWDGNEDKPTLMPSIHVPGVWHGYLRNGVLVSC